MTDGSLEDPFPAAHERIDGPIPQRSEKLSEAVARAIAQSIAARALLPGTTLPAEAVMMDRYQVGRASLREGLRILEINGLISMKPGPGGGPVVAPASSRDFARMSTLHYQRAGATFRELLEARRIIEPMMARLAAEERDQDVVERLRLICARTRAKIADDYEYTHYSVEFHAVVAGASGNRIMNLIGRSVKEVWDSRIPGAQFPMEKRHLVVHDHDAITKAIEAGNGKSAERLMHKHMEQVEEVVAVRFPAALDGVLDWI